MNIVEKFSPSRLLHPIDDLDERAAKKCYSEEERQLRCQLAAAYRLMDLYGWSEGIYNHITVRLPGDDDRFLMNPFGLLFHEITASSLITVDPNGTVLDPGSTRFGINPRGFTLHSAVHQARRDVQCILHMHVPEVISISCTKDGFIPICQEGCAVGPVSLLEFRGILTELDERAEIVACLGKNNALLLRNHGFMTCGVSVADAVLKAYFFIYNIRAQLNLGPKENLILPSAESAKRTYEALRKGETTDQGTDKIQWGPGGMDWEANMRLLDSMGLKTGHKYRLNVWRDE